MVIFSYRIRFIYIETEDRDLYLIHWSINRGLSPIILDLVHDSQHHHKPSLQCIRRHNKSLYWLHTVVWITCKSFWALKLLQTQKIITVTNITGGLLCY